MATLYERIRGLCKEKGVSIPQMCRDVKIPTSTIYELKTGKHDSISSKTALKIANYFDVSVGKLYDPIEVDTQNVTNAVMQGIKKEPPTMDGKTFEMVTLLNQLTTENMAKALDYIQYLLSTQR